MNSIELITAVSCSWRSNRGSVVRCSADDHQHTDPLAGPIDDQLPLRPVASSATESEHGHGGAILSAGKSGRISAAYAHSN